MKTVLVVGSANFDHVYQVRQIPTAGQTVAAISYATHPGGKGMNQAVACARLGARVVFCGCLGADDVGDALVGVMEGAGIDVSHIQRTKEHPTGNASILVSEDGANLITVAGGSNAALDPDHVAATMRAVQPDAVLAQLETNLASVEVASHHPMFFLNPAPAATLPASILARCFAITPNETEAETLAGVLPTDAASCRGCAEKLLAAGAQNVVLTLGSKGSYWASSSESSMIETPTVEAVDTTAAGDVYNGAMVAALMQGSDMAGALQFASRAAALSTTRMGAIPSIPTLAEVQQSFR